MKEPRRLDRALIDESGHKWDIDVTNGYFLPTPDALSLSSHAAIYVQAHYGEPIKWLDHSSPEDRLAAIKMMLDVHSGGYRACLYRFKGEVLLMLEGIE